MMKQACPSNPFLVPGHEWRRRAAVQPMRISPFAGAPALSSVELLARRETSGVADAMVIDGRALAAEVLRQVAEIAVRLRDERRVTAGLSAILVGNDPASPGYVRSKRRACDADGLASFEIRLSAQVSQAALIAEVERLNADERVDGVLVQLPLPGQIDAQSVIVAIDPAKDVDGFHPLNVGRLWSGLPGFVPCTPQACLRLLRAVHPDLSGAEAVVLGRSNIVGKPVAALLLAADCTV